MARLLSAGIVSAALITLGIPATTAVAAPPTCFGIPATLTGAGPLTGTPGRDVIVGSAGADVMDSVAFGGNAEGGGRDHLEGGNGNDGLLGDSATPFQGSATRAGDDVLRSGPGTAESIIGDSEGIDGAHGSGGDDIIDLGADGGIFAIGDHNIGDPAGGQATGAGNDRITGGAADDLLFGDSSVGDASRTFAGKDVIDGRGGDDRLFGDNVNCDGDASVGTAGGRDVLHGDTGDDAIFAGPANDLLDGGANTDSCDGEAGNHDVAVRCESVTNVP
ncbi:calcium-binding protein [Streptomyces sp. NBC_00316]|uniref:calcium-binding protein n=1 Tax=Streptomyces sp. NBC_00316 TaxID=2975710 RepID=UPI002E27F442|nr:hypothetical protein [Streptomyces sp. NBC_00316]